MNDQFSFPQYVFLYGLFAIVFSLALTPLSIYLARRLGLLDVPGKFAHKVHARPVPMAGGTALILCLAALVALLGLWKDGFVSVLVLAAGIIYLFGLWDDARGLSAFPKLVGQVLAGALLISADVSVHFIESIQLPFLSRAATFWLDIGLTLVWLIGVTNAMNMIDSMDGLAVGLSGIAFLFFIPVTLASGQAHLTEISAVLLGICAGLYFFNVTPARLFLGDSGAQTLGFLVAAIAMAYAPLGLSPASSWFVPILLVILPVFDTSLVVYSRLRRRLPVYLANLDHTYHRLVSLGLDERRAVLTIHLAAVMLGLVAFATFYLSPLLANLIFAAILALGGAAIVLLDL